MLSLSEFDGVLWRISSPTGRLVCGEEVRSLGDRVKCEDFSQYLGLINGRDA